MGVFLVSEADPTRLTCFAPPPCPTPSKGPVRMTTSLGSRRLAVAPSVPAWRWYGLTVLAGGIAGTLLSHWTQGLTGDLLWHLAAGRWILQHHAVPRTDPFSWLAGPTPWINLEWGWDLLTALLVRRLGPAGLAVWAALMCAGVAVAQAVRWGRGGVSVLRQADLFLVWCLLAAPFWAWRPQLVSYALVPLWWAILETSSDHPRRLWALPAMLLVWEQLHAGYLLALGSTVLWVLDRLVPGHPAPLRGPAWRPLWGPLLLGAGVLGLTPWGYGSLVHALWESRQPALWQWIAEWQSPSFHTVYPIFGIGLPALGLAVGLYRDPAAWRRVPRWLWLLLGVTLGLTLLAVRNAPFWALAWVTVVGWAWPGSRPAPYVSGWAAAATAAGLIGVGAVVAPSLWRPTAALPSPIVARLRADPGRVLNSYRVGDALIAAGIPDSLDGRTDLWIAAGAFPRLVAFSHGLTPWPVLARWLHQHHVRWILWPTADPGTAVITGRPGIAPVLTAGGLTLFRVTRPGPAGGGAPTSPVSSSTPSSAMSSRR